MTTDKAMQRGDQFIYNKLLNAFNAKTKSKKDSVDYLLGKGFSVEQAENAVHVYLEGRRN